MTFDNWDQRFIMLAEHISRWSKDPSTKCGAVVVRPDRTIASMGFNGFPMGISDAPLLTRGRQDKLDRIIHAEMNALLFLRENAFGFTIYTWPFLSCNRCAVHIIQAGIKRTVSPAGEPDRWKGACQIARQLYYEASVAMDEVDVSPFYVSTSYRLTDEQIAQAAEAALGT